MFSSEGGIGKTQLLNKKFSMTIQEQKQVTFEVSIAFEYSIHRSFLKFWRTIGHFVFDLKSNQFHYIKTCI